MLQYELGCLKKILLRNLALVACFEYEFIYGFRLGKNSVSNKIRPRSNILKKKKPNVLIRFSDDVTEDYLEEALSAIITAEL